MDSSGTRNFHNLSDPSESGLLRFRSAPSTLFAGDDSAPVTGFREFDIKSAAKVEEAAASGYPSSTLTRSCSGLPPHYPKQNTTAAAVAGVDRDSSYGLLAPLGAAAAAAKTVDYSGLARQRSSPAGLFVDLSAPQNGNGF